MKQTTRNNGRHGRAGRTKKILWTVVGVLIALILAIHLFLPGILLKKVNKGLADIPGYHGHVEDLDVSLLRGAYTMNGIKFNKLDAGDTLPVFSARHVDFSVEWSALLRGKIVSEVVLVEPRLIIRPGSPHDTAQFDLRAMHRTIEGFFPFTTNGFDIQNGAVHFQDPARSSTMDLQVDRIYASARGLTNAQELNKAGDEKDPLPASFRLTGQAMGHAPLTLNLAIAPLAESPTFDLDAELKALNLVTLNSFFRAYAKVDVEKGTFSVYTEVAVADGGFKGYLKPLTKDLEILDLARDKGSIAEVAWEVLIAGLAHLLENPPEQQVGTKIPFQGTFSDPKADIWSTVAYLLRNAFVRALHPGIENSIKLKGGPTLKE